MACMTACPSGVRYDVLIEETRAEVERQHPRPLRERIHRGLIFAIFPYPGRLKVAVALLLVATWTGLKWLLQKLRLMPELTPPVGAHQLFAGLPEQVPALGQRRARVALVAGCVQRVFFPGVNEATLRVLAAEG